MAPKPATRKKIEIEYPPVARKKWVPPDQRPKEPRVPAYVKPKGINQPLKISSLLKVWNRFILCNNKFVLAGSFSQTHKRFRLKTNGMQGSCNCVVACLMQRLFKMEVWNFNLINQILCTGDLLYERSVSKLGDKSVGAIGVTKIYTTFYLYRYMITFQVVNPTEPARLETTADQDQSARLGRFLTDFFADHASGVMKFEQQRHVAMWKHEHAYFLFDPTEHQKNGEKWNGLLSTGFAICMRFLKVQSMADYIVSDCVFGKTLIFKLWPIEMMRCQGIALKAPENLDEVRRVNEEQEKMKEMAKTFQAKETHKQALQEAKAKKTAEAEPSHSKSEKTLENIKKAEEISPEAVGDGDHKDLMVLKKHEDKSKIPTTPHVGKSITHFTIINEDKMGIIRGTTHQMDKKFSRFRNGEQSISQAVAALVMRRCFPTRQWIRKFVNDILKLGETIHHKSLKDKPEGPFKLSSITKKIVHPPGTYTLDFDELALLGKLESVKDGVLDLLPALMTFLRTYDCCIINGPLTLAVWYEDNRYYMYDPNERNGKGKKDPSEPGVACITWFTALRDLVRLYVDNLDKEQRREDFHLSRVTVEDFVGTPENWNNFNAIVKGKWILRGTMSQSSHIFSSESRNTQCTANAAMSIAFVHIKQPSQWSKKTVDQVLMSGDEFYRSAIQRLTDNNKMVSKMLMVDELNRNFSFSNKEVEFEINDCCVNGILGYPDHGDVLNIKTGLKRFFEDYDFGVLTCRNISVAVWRKDGAFYYFDSHNRDNKGVITPYGTACLLRVLTIEDLAKSIESNLYPDKISHFNIGAVNVKLLDAEVEGGTVRQPLNNFKQNGGNVNAAILLAKTSNKDPKYEFNAGKQTVPMCVAALGMNKLRPSAGWKEDTIQTILDIGQKYFEDCMADYEASREEIEEDKGITSKQLGKEFKIGLNKMEVNLEQLAEGFVEDGLAQTITDYYTTNDKITDQSNLELLVETENITVSVWKDPYLYYVFDPYPRDANGQVIGKDAWSAKIEIEIAVAAVDDTASATAGESVNAAVEEGGGDVVVTAVDEKPKRPKSSGEGVFEADAQSIKDSDVDGKACVLFFYSLDDLVKHILENTRPNRRAIMPFTINKVNITNTPIVKEIYDKDFGDRKDVYSGNWYDFVELDHGHWILRGQIDLNNEMFPKDNRGKQEYPCIVTALAFGKIYSMSKMKPQHITSILSYGDRLLTYTKRARAEELARNNDLNLLEEEIKAIIKNEKYDLEAYPNSFVIGDYKVKTTMTRDFLIGDITAKQIKDVLDVQRGLDELFKTAQFGIIECKGYSVGVWKGATVFYMFDPHKTGVNGVKSLIGYPSITRYLKTDLMADIYLQNIPKDGHNTFYIHKVDIKEDRFQRPKDVMEQGGTTKPAMISGFTEIIPGKSILRGSFSQDDPKFGKGENVLSAPVAYIALTMSLIHKPQTWSKPIVDEVLSVADELFEHTVKVSGPGFNPWEDSMDPYTVAKDYRVGVMKANCQFRNNDQKGILDMKDPYVLNLRQGLERFFAENNHGILHSPPNMCYAIWEEENQGLPILYMYDPNKRGATGLPSPHGTSCVVTFGSPKMAADHILACLTKPEEKKQKFTLIPVEITVGPYKTSRKKAKTKTKATVDPDIMKKLAHQAVLDDRKMAKKKAIEQKKKADAKKRFWQGRTGYFEVPKAHAILRGTRCLTSACYQEKTRGLQDIPVCIVAFVANCIVPISDWTWKEIDAVLDTGDQLYIDSYIAYGPRDKKLGLENVVRNIFILNNKAHVTVYKPITIYGFHANQLQRNLDKWFLDQNFCMLNYIDQWVAVFFKKGYYFLFDPHERGATGCRTAQDGAACVLRFEKIDDLATKLINNLVPASLPPDEEMEEAYELVLVRLEGGICQCG